MTWIARQSAVFNYYFEIAFAMEWVHVVMHILLYAGLSILLMFGFNWHPNLKVFGLILFIALLLGITQEILQQVAGHIPYFRWNSLFDIGVNLVGTVIGFGLMVWYKRVRPSH